MGTAIITGASRGVGRGIAMALAGLGYDLCVTGRSALDLDQIKSEVEKQGRHCATYICDHQNVAATVACFESISKTHELTLIVNNAWGGYETMMQDGQYTWEAKFWDQSLERWTSMMDVGVRTAFLCSKYCVQPILRNRRGAIVNISFWSAQRYMQNLIYGVSKAAIDKMTMDMAHELREYNIPAIALYPGLVRTEKVMENAAYFDMSNSESPEFVGLVIHGFMEDQKRLEKSGQVFTTAELASEYRIKDIDGKTIQDIRG